MSENQKSPSRPDFKKAGGLVPVIAQDAETGDVLMMAFMNEEAWEKTIETGEVHYYSRSRQELWHKGGTSGNVQKIKALFLDCDADAVLVKIDQIGDAACHTGLRTCFHFRWQDHGFQKEGTPLFDPREVYKK